MAGRRRAAGKTTLSIDIGGTGLKASVLDGNGKMLTERVRVETPAGQPPAVIVVALTRLVSRLPAFDRVSVGFPGVVRDGVVRTAPHLRHRGWHGYDLGAALGKRLGKPVRVINDADMQGLAAIKGRGLEMVVTLGTGFGTALYQHGRLAPHLEIAHAQFRKGETFDEQLGNAARKRVGRKAWNRRVRKAIQALHALTHFDHLHIGGGNGKHLEGGLPDNVTVVSNEAGITGGVHLWDPDVMP